MQGRNASTAMLFYSANWGNELNANLGGSSATINGTDNAGWINIVTKESPVPLPSSYFDLAASKAALQALIRPISSAIGSNGALNTLFGINQTSNTSDPGPSSASPFSCDSATLTEDECSQCPDRFWDAPNGSCAFVSNVPPDTTNPNIPGESPLSGLDDLLNKYFGKGTIGGAVLGTDKSNTTGLSSWISDPKKIVFALLAILLIVVGFNALTR